MPRNLLGQHFLHCSWAVEAALQAAHVTAGDVILEIGPGNGVLTRRLAKEASRVIGVEKDPVLCQALELRLRQEKITNVTLVPGDILRVFPQLPMMQNRIDQKAGMSYSIVANIPYYITGRLLRTLFAAPNLPTRVVLMVQKEVALRLCSSPPRMNLLALSVQAFGTPRIIVQVPRSCFTPEPGVDSAIISISNISRTWFAQHEFQQEDFFELIKQAFSQKRKTLANTLGRHYAKDNVLEILKDRGLSPAVRAQELSREDWAYIASRIGPLLLGNART